MARSFSKSEFTALKCLYRKYVSGSKRRKKKLDVTMDFFSQLIVKPCFYCGSPPLSLFNRHGAKLLYTGIDRLGNEAGYTMANCVPCCRKCNYLKGRFTPDGFLRQVNAIALYFLKLRA